MTLRLSLALLLCSPTFLSAAVPFGSERALIAPRTVFAEGSQVNASVASSGSETLVAWIDTTLGREGVYVAALTDEGKLVSGSQRRLTTGATTVTLTWSGQSYLALWSGAGGGIFAATLDGERRMLATPRLAFPGVHVASAIEWAGSRGMFVYVTRTGTYEAALIDREGAAIRSGIVIPGANANTVRVFSDGQAFLAIWDVRTDRTAEVYAARYTAEGELRDATPVKLTTLGQFSGTWEAAFDGSRFALALAEAGTESSTLRRYVIDPATLQTTVLPTVDMGATNGVRVEWNGSRFIAYWLRHAPQSYELQTLAFSAEGAGDAAPVTATTRQGTALQPSGAWNGRALVVAWAGTGFDTGETYDVYVAAVADGTDLSLSHFPIALAPSWQRRPSAATDGHQSLIVWLEGMDQQSASLVAAHATAGVIDSAPAYLSDKAFGPAQVVFTGEVYLVFWLERTGNIPRAVMRRLSLSGRVLDEEETFLANSSAVSAAFNGTHVLVAYKAPDGIEAIRLKPDGKPFDTTPLLFPAIADPGRMVSNGSDFALVWQEGSDWWQFPSPGYIDVYAAIISGSGSLLNGRIEVATGNANEHTPAIASNGTDFMIAYIEERSLVTKKLLPSGTVVAGGVLDSVAEPGAADGPFIAGSDDGYIAGWEVIDGNASLVRAVRIEANGAVTDAVRTVARSDIYGMFPMLATGGGTTGDLVYARLYDDDAYGGAMRLFVRRLGERAPGRSRAVRH